MADSIQVQPFGVKFDEAVRFLKDKLPEGTLKWDDLAGPVKAKVFTLAGATNVDLVGDIQKSLVSALENGTTITQFRKDWDAAVQKHGWTYKGKRGWRTAVVFNNNMRSAAMAGRWEQLQANKANRPFLQYRTAGDARVRPQHRQWNGLIFPIDHSFWQTHYPPNGWGCRCTIRAYGQAEMDDKGLKAETAFDLKTRTVTSKDGTLKDQVPVGIDPGWDHNVGQAWIAPEQALGQKIAALPASLKGVFAQKSVSPAFQKVLNERWKSFYTASKKVDKRAPFMQIAGFLDEATLAAIDTLVPELKLASTAIAGSEAKTDHLSGAHKSTGSPKQAWPEDWTSTLPQRLREYRAVLWDKEKPGLIFLMQDSFNDWVPYVATGPVNHRVEGFAWNQAAIVSLGARPASEWGARIKVDGQLTERYLTLLGKKP